MQPLSRRDPEGKAEERRGSREEALTYPFPVACPLSSWQNRDVCHVAPLARNIFLKIRVVWILDLDKPVKAILRRLTSFN